MPDQLNFSCCPRFDSVKKGNIVLMNDVGGLISNTESVNGSEAIQILTSSLTNFK